MGHLKTQGLPVKVPAHPLAPLGANLVHRDYLEGRIPFQKSPSHSLVDTVSLGGVLHDDPDQGSWPSPASTNGLEVRQEIQVRLYGGSCHSRREQKQATGFLACSPGEGSPLWGEGIQGSLGWKSDLGSLPTPWGVLCAGGSLLLLPTPCSWPFRSSSSFCYLISHCPESGPTAHAQLFLVP